MYKIGIILRTYNSIKFVEDCLNSIAAQTIINDCKVIYIDDCSTDGTAEFVKNYLQAHNINSHIIVHIKNEGVGQGMIEAQSMVDDCEYVMTIDSDDFCRLPQALEKCYNYAKKRNSEYISFGPNHVHKIIAAHLYKKVRIRPWVVGEDRYYLWIERHAKNPLRMQYNFYAIRFRLDSISHSSTSRVMAIQEFPLRVCYENIFYLENDGTMLADEDFAGTEYRSYKAEDYFKKIVKEDLPEKIWPMYDELDEFFKKKH